MSIVVATFPVDNSLTPEEAWHEIQLFGKRVTYSGIVDPETGATETWAMIQVDDEEIYMDEVDDE